MLNILIENKIYLIFCKVELLKKKDYCYVKCDKVKFLDFVVVIVL